MKTTGHKILITGGSSGIGLSITRKLLALGNDIIITGRNLQKLEAVKEELGRIDFLRDTANICIFYYKSEDA